jgi:hypothetical protein
MANKEVRTMQAGLAGVRRRPGSGRMLAFLALAIVALTGLTGSASAQPYPWPVGVNSPQREALQPSGLYYTNGPGTFGRDTTSSPPPYQLEGGALTIVGDSSWTLSRWMTQTTAIADGRDGLQVHGGGYVIVGVWMRTLSVPGYANIALTFWDADLRYIGSTSSTDLKGTTDWTPMHFFGLIPDGTKYVRIEFRLSGPGKVWIGGASGTPEWAYIMYPYPPAVNLTPPSVSGLAQVGQLLTATPGTWDGTGATSGYSFRWYRCDAAGQNCVLIPDAGGDDVPNGPDPPNKYTVRPDDVGSTIRVAVKVNAEVPADFVLSAPTAVVTSAGGNQLAPDPGFEVDPAPFYYGHGPGSFSWATDAARGGTHALKVVSTSGQLSRWLSQMRAIQVAPGRSYDVSAWLKTLGAQAKARLAVNFWTAGGAYIPATVDAPTLSGTHDWTEQTLHLTAPPGAAYLRVEFRLDGPGTLWADDLTVTH